MNVSLKSSWIPYRIKMVEPIVLRPARERWQRMEEAGYNVFFLRSRDVYIDLLTDSGTGAMSDRQWALMMRGDEAYAGSQSFEMMQATIEYITGYPYVLPVHQGRGAERVFFGSLLEPGQVVPSNTHFDTTRANIQLLGARAVDLPVATAVQSEAPDPFKGNIDLDRLQDLLRREGRARVPLVMMTLTNNAVGGQPVSLENVRQLKEILDRYGIPLFLDAARFAENAFLVKQRTPELARQSVAEIARAFFDLADGCLVSAKKDGIVPIGGFIAVRSRDLYQRLQNALVSYEGFLTYGGMAGHDMAALAMGLQESLQESYLAYRVGQVAELHGLLNERGVPLVHPPGGHAVFVVAEQWFDHIPVEEFPAQALVVALYLAGGIRAVEIGSLMLAETDRATGEVRRPAHEYVRLALPRRVYTLEHLQYVAAVMEQIGQRPTLWPGFRIREAPPVLRHFLARMEPTGPLPKADAWDSMEH